MPSEQALAKRLRKRDPEAWAGLYEEYMPKIYRYIALKVSNRHDAEDLTEQVFLKALESSGRFGWTGAPIASWLFRIARNQVIDFWRTDKTKRLTPLHEWLVDHEMGPEAVAELNADMRLILEAMAGLTRAQRDVIELRFGAGLTTAEVARILGKSQGAVKVMQHAALAALRQKLEGRCEDGQAIARHT